MRRMLGRGWNLRALTRDPGSRAAKALADQGVEVVQGDLEDLGSFEDALCGVYGVYSVQDFWAVGARREVAQGKNLVDAAKKKGRSRALRIQLSWRSGAKYRNRPLGEQMGDRETHPQAGTSLEGAAAGGIHGGLLQ